MRIGIDAMGADRAPAEEVKGALAACAALGPQDRIILIGNEPAIRQHLPGGALPDQIEIRHTDQVIGMDDPPVETLRARPNSSIAVLAQMHADRQIDACISAGNTGAFVAAATMRLRRLENVHRPGIAVVTPTFHGPVVLCDVGANVNCRPQHLHQYGVMASTYAEVICGVTRPRVGLLSVGEEDAKGNDLVKRTHELLREDPSVNFQGNVEGRDIFRGVADVVLCDGFVGNVVLKLMEGMTESLLKAVLAEVSASMPAQLPVIMKAVKGLADKWDFNEYGGAPLLGVDGICIICHGASDHRGIMNAVRVAKDFAVRGVNENIVKKLATHQGAAS